jgi:hypothetical protein
MLTTNITNTPAHLSLSIYRYLSISSTRMLSSRLTQVIMTRATVPTCTCTVTASSQIHRLSHTLPSLSLRTLIHITDAPRISLLWFTIRLVGTLSGAISEIQKHSTAKLLTESSWQAGLLRVQRAVLRWRPPQPPQAPRAAASFPVCGWNTRGTNTCQIFSKGCLVSLVSHRRPLKSHLQFLHFDCELLLVQQAQFHLQEPDLMVLGFKECLRALKCCHVRVGTCNRQRVWVAAASSCCCCCFYFCIELLHLRMRTVSGRLHST